MEKAATKSVLSPGFLIRVRILKEIKSRDYRSPLQGSGETN